MSAINERPILFSVPMVQAILAGRKTMTRRVVKKPAALDALAVFGPSVLLKPGCADLCPYGKPGDHLWVRETWAHYQTINHIRRTDGRAFSEASDGLAGYRADGHDTIDDFKEHVRLMSGCDLEGVEVNGDRWRPSIHMPRWASRITLRITEVRVERLHQITSADAIAEGCPAHANSATIDCDTPNPLNDFRDLWNSINGPGAWDANPWVWVVKFERTTP